MRVWEWDDSYETEHPPGGSLSLAPAEAPDDWEPDDPPWTRSWYCWRADRGWYIGEEYPSNLGFLAHLIYLWTESWPSAERAAEIIVASETDFAGAVRRGEIVQSSTPPRYDWDDEDEDVAWA